MGIVHCGACSPGLNAAVRALTRLAVNRGHSVLGVSHGFKGLIDGEVSEMGWMSVNGWAREGGARLGVSRDILVSDQAVFDALYKHNMGYLVMIGGVPKKNNNPG
jgi:6-phosphofructokinase 1